MTRFFLYLQVSIFILIGVSAIFYFDFTAEDAYITYRYAENWVNHGSLVYNEGEPINAMTSPLHAVLSAALFFLFDNTVIGNKILSVILVSISAFLVWYRYKNHSHWQVLAFILLFPPCVLLWTFGGLETPILLFLATLTVNFVKHATPFRPIHTYLTFFLAGLAFLTRYDSILFFLPAVFYAALQAKSIKHVAMASAAGAILPLIWLIVSLDYYGDLLPTSFYVKTPKGHAWDLIFNGRYIASYLLFVGIVPVIALAIVLLLSKHKTIETLYRELKGVWWLYAGLLLELIYGLTMATHHMMFSFRFFVPYLPSTVILAVDLMRRAAATLEKEPTIGKPAFLYSGFLLSLILFQLYQNVYTYNHSVNGISSIGEYRALSVRKYIDFLEILKQESFDIENHWNTINDESRRRPRIITYAAGMLPYTYRESYIYEKLVSYRHCHERYRQGLYADYIHILAPRQGQVEQQLPMPEDNYDLVSSYEMLFDGSMQRFLVYYNPEPEEHNLTARIYEFCESGNEDDN